jgi:hypothetical protein|tara:strand:- start:2260 stop:2625 length:366 start_codon:yes stop_codon:yes gene_type:complete
MLARHRTQPAPRFLVASKLGKRELHAAAMGAIVQHVTQLHSTLCERLPLQSARTQHDTFKVNRLGAGGELPSRKAIFTQREETHDNGGLGAVVPARNLGANGPLLRDVMQTACHILPPLFI